MPSRGAFSSVYDAVNLEKCNVSKDAESNSVENVLKKRYTMCKHLHLLIVTRFMIKGGHSHKACRAMAICDQDK